MNQKLSWTLVAAGGAMFLFQFGDLIAHHSTWSEVLSPAGTGDILRTLGGVLLAVFGAIGVRFDVEDRQAVTAATLKNLSLVVLAVSLALGSSCGIHSGPITPTPTPDQIQKTRDDAVRIAQATGSAADIGVFILTTADSLEKLGTITPPVLATIAATGQAFGKGAKTELAILRDVSQQPSLLKTAQRIVGYLTPFLNALEASNTPVLRALGASLRLAMTFVTSYTGPGEPTSYGTRRDSGHDSGRRLGGQGAPEPHFDPAR